MGFTTGELVHDDLVMSAALCAVLDKQKWYYGGPTLTLEDLNVRTFQPSNVLNDY